MGEEKQFKGIACEVLAALVVSIVGAAGAALQVPRLLLMALLAAAVLAGPLRARLARTVRQLVASGRPWNDQGSALLLAFLVLASVNALFQGLYRPAAIPWLLGVLPFCLLSWRSYSGNTVRLGTLLLLALLIETIVLLQGGSAWGWLSGATSWGDLVAVVVLGVLAVAIRVRPAAGVCLGLGALLWIFAGLAQLVIGGMPRPSIDVWDMLQGASEAMLNGRNPYTANAFEVFIPAGSEYSGSVVRHFLYFPLTLIPTTAGLAWGGDVRWGFVAVSLVAASLLAAAVAQGGQRPAAWLALLFAAAMLNAPDVETMWRWAWTDPLLVCFLALLLWSWQSGRVALAGVALGGLLGTKQHALVFLPFALMLTRERRFWIAATATVAASILPFLAADPHAFLDDAVLFHFNSPFRADALNLTAHVWNTWHVRLPGWAPLPPALLVLWLAARRRPFGLPEFYQYSGAFYFLVLLLSKHAFLNYYYLVESLWLLGAAASWCAAGRPEERAEERLRAPAEPARVLVGSA